MEFSGISVVVLETAQAVAVRAQVELETVLKRAPDALVSFAAGETFDEFFDGIERDVEDGRLDLAELRATHLDEFVGFGPEDEGGFAHHLLQRPMLAKAWRDGRFLPVPGKDNPESWRAHEAQLEQLGGIQLQFLGIGANGHVALSEPGTDLELGFHRARLAAMTVSALQSRCAPNPVPSDAITAGPASILAAARVVLVATGAGKAKAVRDMMERDVGPACPASLVRRHQDAVVLLDSAAAQGLDWPEMASSASS